MDKLFLTILNMSFTGAFVIAAICLVRLPLKKAPKIISYCLWAVAGFRLIFPFTIESVFSLIPFKPAPIPPDIAMQAVPRIDSGISIVNNAVSSVLPAATPAASANPLQIWTAIGAYVWLAIAAAMIIYGLASYARLKHKMRPAARIEGNIYECAAIRSPFVLGVLRPKIYLPLNLAGQEREYIILHEQTHIRRRDHIVKFAAYFILCLHWFNPLAWAAFLLLGVDMEMSCDERVLKKMGGERKKDYSLSLLSLASQQHLLTGSPLAFSEGGLKARIKNVLNFKKPSRVIIIAAVALVIALSVGFAVNRVQLANPIQVEQNISANTAIEQLTNSTVASINMDIAEIVERNLNIITGSPSLHSSITPYIEAHQAAYDEIVSFGDAALAYMISLFEKGGQTGLRGWIMVFACRDILGGDDGFPPSAAGTGQEWYDENEYLLKAAVRNNTAYSPFSDRQSLQRTLALNEVRRLAAKGDDLLFEDFSSYGGANASSDLNYNIMVYSVQGGYRLVVASKPSGKPDSVALESIWESGESGIDIRYNDVDAFIQANPSRPSLSAREALLVLKYAQEFAGATLEPVSWEVLGNEPVPRSPEAIFARNLLDSLDVLVEEIAEPCWLFHCVSIVPTDEQYLAVGKKTGVVYSGSADTGGKVKIWIWQKISPEHPGFFEPEIPADYSLENAKADGLVVYEDSSITSGQDVWDEFVENTEIGNPSKVRLAFYFTLGDGSHYAPELYKEIKDDYPALYIQDLSFDGEMYTLFSIEEGRAYTYSYKYLKRFEEIMNIRTKYSKRILYVLLNDNEKTWPQISWGMLSSQLADKVDHQIVYSKYYLKE